MIKRQSAAPAGADAAGKPGKRQAENLAYSNRICAPGRTGALNKSQRIGGA